MTERACPACRRGRLEQKVFDFETEVEDGRGQTRQLRIPQVAADLCPLCGEAFFEKSSQRRIVASQREALGLLSAAEIRRLRGARTQAQMSELLGIGEKTYTRWESESHFQSEAFDRFLRLLALEARNWELLEKIALGKQMDEDATVAAGAGYMPVGEAMEAESRVV